MRQVVFVFLVCVVVSFVPQGLVAQQEDPTQDLLNLGRRAFDDLDYHGADSIARLTLSIPGLRRTQRIQALELAAASRYPAGEHDQYPDSALVPLRALARIAPAAAIPRTLSWRGLDSLFNVARSATFGVSVSVPDTSVVTGINGQVSLEVVATRPATFSLRLARPGDPGLGEVLDSIGPAVRGTLRFAPVQTDQPRYPSGTYRLTVIAIDPSSGDRIDRLFTASLELPPVTVQRVPVPEDSTLLRPERTRPSRVSAIVSGIVIGGFVYGTARAYRAPAIKSAGAAVDPRTTTWAIGLGLSMSAISWYLDKGRMIEPNVQFNAALRKRWSADNANVQNTNGQARVSYRGIVRLTEDDQ
jgi:hypothetical protein